jgi:predicted nucleotidyltransferase
MKKKLLNLSGKINDDILQALEHISKVADKLKIPIFVVGAMAREILLHVGYGIESKRATLDLDLGVQVEDWNQFTKLKNSLIATGTFRESRESQKIIFKEKLHIDTISFGQISEPEDSISWPLKQEVRMSTLGFRESYDNAVVVRLRSNPDFEIKFASLCGLAIMKIISWNEKYPERTKDAVDLDILMRNYIYAGIEKRIYHEESDLLEDEDFDYEFASARLLGRDIASISKPKTKEVIQKILKQQTGKQSRYLLVEDMMRSNSVFKDNFNEKLRMIEEFKKGFIERL